MNAELMRLDKWLWAARFFKTRALAQKNIELGRVSLNGIRAKASKTVTVGDVLDLNINGLPHKITVRGLNPQRRPADEACLLYLEDQAVAARREQIIAMNRIARNETQNFHGRPTKRDRRLLDRFKSRDS